MLRRKFIAGALLGVLSVTVACAARKPGSAIRPGINLFSKEQDVQLGREAAAQVLQQYPVAKDQNLQAYVDRLGGKLASTSAAGGYPYEFTLLHQKEINAFALPGGPVFVFTGLIAEADNEAQVAGVLAHEIAHVALRHGTNQVSKANLMQIPAALAGAAIGNGALGQVVQLGLGVGLNGLFLKYSRDAENQADALGARIMAEAGYNPIEMARFFEKLEATGGSRSPEFLSSHPNPGNRVQAVEAELRTFPQRQYNASTGDFQRAKQEVAALGPAPEPRQVASAAPQGGPQTDGASGGFRQLQSSRFALAYPADWVALGDQNSQVVTLAPRQGLVQNTGGDVAVGYGAVVSYFSPQSSNDLGSATQELIKRLQQSNPSIRVRSRARQVQVGGSPGLITTLSSQSPLGRGQSETDVLVTVARPEGLFYMVLVAPSNNFQQIEAAFHQMVQSVRFAG
ncbi:MAG TPA: M48 family metallopeptidase [Bryobacteraceae bacterium]|nr:M48 family metallopeptidase [Bryobacteraceae bacterium]